METIITYLIRLCKTSIEKKEMLEMITSCYEYVIFSDSARKGRIPQYVDNRKLYGRISFAETAEELAKEPWLYEFDDVKG